jgi:hypothetical protein
MRDARHEVVDLSGLTPEIAKAQPYASPWAAPAGWRRRYEEATILRAAQAFEKIGARKEI